MSKQNLQEQYGAIKNLTNIQNLDIAIATFDAILNRISNDIAILLKLDHYIRTDVDRGMTALLGNHLSGHVSIHSTDHLMFSVAPKRLYKSACPSVRRSVGRSVGRSVCDAFVLGATYAVYTALFFC